MPDTSGAAIEVPDRYAYAPALVQRIAGRAQAEGRADDTPEAVANRLRVYSDQTAPVIDYYRERGRLVCVYGVGAMEEVSDRILSAIRSATADEA